MTTNTQPLPLTRWQRLRRSFTTGWTLTKVVTWAVGGFIGLLLLLFVLAAIYAWTNDAVEAASRMDYWRNLISIFISLQIIVIVVAIGILIVQIARFVNLLRSEVKPITQDAQQTAQTARATAEFVSKHSVEPVIKTLSFTAGLLAFLREIVQLGRILKRQNGSANHDDKQ
jgi:hypothetical protein